MHFTVIYLFALTLGCIISSLCLIALKLITPFWNIHNTLARKLSKGISSFFVCSPN